MAIITTQIQVSTLRKMGKKEDPYYIDSDDVFSDAFIKAVCARSVIISKYPNMSQFLKNGRKNYISFPSTSEEIDGNNAPGPGSIITDGNLIIRNFKSLKSIMVTTPGCDLIVDNCPKLEMVKGKSFRNININMSHKKTITLETEAIENISVPNTLVYQPPYDYANNFWYLPKKKLGNLYSMKVTIDNQAELDACSNDAFNVNVLNIYSSIRDLDMTRFNVSNVTTLIIRGEPDIRFNYESLTSVISWTSGPITKIELPESSRLLFLFIIAEKSREETRNKVFEYPQLYRKGLCRGKLKMEIRWYKGEWNGEQIDVDELLALSEAMVQNPKNARKE